MLQFGSPGLICHRRGNTPMAFWSTNQCSHVPMYLTARTQSPPMDSVNENSSIIIQFLTYSMWKQANDIVRL